MEKRRKIFISIFTGLFTAFILILAVAAIILTHIDIETKAHQSIQKLSNQFNIHTTYENAGLAFFPFPHLVLEHVNIGMLGQADIVLERLNVYPKSIFLFIGKFKLAKLELVGLTSTITTDRFIDGDNTIQKKLSFSFVKKQLNSWSALLSEKLPGLKFYIDNGKIDLVDDKDQIAFLADIKAKVHLHPQKIRFYLQCRSNIWELARLHGNFNLKTSDSTGRIDFKDLHIQNIPNNFFPQRSFSFSRFSSDIQLDFKTEGGKTITGTIQGAIPDAMIRVEGQKPVIISCDSLKGSFDFSEKKAQVVLDKLVTPFADLTGNFHIDQAAPATRLLIEGSITDVAKARKAALVFAGKFRTTQKICDIIRGGQISRFFFLDNADSVKGLKNVNNILIKGSMNNGTILTPKSDLKITEASGSVSLTKGVLYGKQLSGRLGNSYGTEGKFAIGLIGKQAPFYLETRIEADLSQLPPILQRLIKNKNFKREMDLVKNTKGHALGKLILGDRKNNIRPKVRVESFLFETDYGRIPLPIKLDGKNFIYDHQQIDIKTLNGTVGRSDLTDITASINWRETPQLRCSGRNLHIDAEEIYPWFMSTAGLSPSPQKLEGIHGMIQLSDIHVTGPFLKPADWLFSTSGKTEEITISDTRPFGAPAQIEGEFNLTEKLIDVKNAALHFQDAWLNGDGKLSWDSKNIEEGEINITGNLGKESLSWVLNKIHLPIEIKKESAVTLSDTNVHWTFENKFEFKGVMIFNNGQTLTAHISRNSNRLHISNLHLKDNDSDARMSFEKNADSIYLDFKGNVNHPTLDKLLENNPFQTGLIEGSFQLGFETSCPEKALFVSDIRLENITFLPYIQLPARINRATFLGDSNDCDLNAVLLLENSDQLDFKGKLFSETNDRRLVLDVTSNRIDLNSFLKFLMNLKNQKTSPHKDRFWAWDIGGKLQTKIEELEFNGYTWSPVTANIALAPEEINITIQKADLCGIETPGNIIVTPDMLQLEITPIGDKQKMEEVLPCFTRIDSLIQGTLNLEGIISAKGSFDTFTQTINGDLKLSTHDGRIYRFSLLAKIFSLLNITEIFRGTLPDLTQEGFKYHTMDVSGKLSGDTLIIEQAFIDGAAMDMAFQGKINRKDKTMDVTLLVTPLKTVDFIMKKTPLVKNIMDGGLISIAFKINGELSDPTITFLPAAAVGESIISMMKKTLKLPVTLIEPIIKRETQFQKEN